MAGYVKPTRQPQGAVNLARGSRFLVGVQAILTGTSRSNLVTGVALTNVGTVAKGAVAPSHIADTFRKSSYRATELLPAIGAADFVEFWLGIPRAYGAAAPTPEGGFVTGSSTNQTGLMINMRSGGGNWGAVFDWATSAFDDSGQILPLDTLTFLLLARYQNRTELWRDGRLAATLTHGAISYPASKLIIGSFIEDTAYWSSSSDTVLAGRVINTWAAADIRSFMANPWQIFQGQQRRLLVDAPAAVGTNIIPGTGALALAGFVPSVSQPQTISPGPAAFAITGYAPSVNQSATLTPGPGALALTGYAPAVTQPKTLTPGAGALVIAGFAPSVSQVKTISPLPGALVITSRAPTISQPQTVSPGAGQLVVAGYAPSISQTYFVAPQVYAFTIMSDHAIDASVPALSGNINATSTLRASFNASTIMSAHPINGTGTISAKPINGTANLL